MERTFVMIKPDGVRRGLIGEVIGRFERRGLKLAGMKLMQADEGLARKHYGEHEGKPFFEPLVEFLLSGPVVAMAWEGKEAVRLARRMLGALKPEEADAGTIRGDLTCSMRANVAHASDSPENAARELALWFGAGELVTYDRDCDPWMEM